MPRSVSRRALGALSLVAMTLLVAGLFPPWIIRIDYLAHAHCPNGPGCPPPTLDGRSLWALLLGDGSVSSLQWWYGLVMSLGPLVLLLLLQLAIALAGLRNRWARPLFAVGLAGAVLVGGYYLLAARVYYCLFYCGTGLFTAPGVRILAAGFWLLLAGFAIAVVSNLALLVVGGPALARPE